MPAVRVIPAFDEVEDCEPRLGLRAESSAIEQLTLSVAKKLSQSALS